MKAERQKEPEQGGGSDRKMGRWRGRVSAGQETEREYRVWSGFSKGFVS